MKFITIILKEENFMKIDRLTHPFMVLVHKEFADNIRSWKFIIMLTLILLSCFGALYASLSDFSTAVKNSSEDGFFFLKLFTHSNGTLPSFLVFIGFLGPLLGISIGFDAINAEHSRGTMSRLLAQPIYRDYVLNAKFIAALLLLTVLFVSMTLLVLGFGLIFIGIPPTAQEFLRMISFAIVVIIYVAFWLNLSLLFSVKFRQAATSALAGIAVWLFFSVFYGMIVDLIAKSVYPGQFASRGQIIGFQVFIHRLQSLNPAQLFNDAVNTLLLPSVRSTGPIMMEQSNGAIPTPLPLGQSWMIIWPQLTALLAGTITFFGLAYQLFMKREIRSR